MDSNNFRVCEGDKLDLSLFKGDQVKWLNADVCRFIRQNPTEKAKLYSSIRNSNCNGSLWIFITLLGGVTTDESDKGLETYRCKTEDERARNQEV